MLRFFAGVGSTLLFVLAGFFAWKSIARPEADPIAAAPSAQVAAADDPGGAGRTPPSADARTREQRRFDRVDRDRNGRITLEEMTYARRRAFARLDTDHNGQLSFDEWAVRTLQKFAGADSNHDRALDRTEFATTAPRPRRASVRSARCDCTNQPVASNSTDED